MNILVLNYVNNDEMILEFKFTEGSDVSSKKWIIFKVVYLNFTDGTIVILKIL